MTADNLTVAGIMALQRCYKRERIEAWLGRLGEPTLLAACDLADLTTPDLLWLAARVLRRRERACFAAACAEYVLPIWERYAPDDERPARAIAAARAGDREAAEAADAANVAAWAAAEAATWTAADAAWAAADAAWSTAGVAAWAAAEAAGAAAKAAEAAAEAIRAWQRARLRGSLASEIPWEQPVPPEERVQLPLEVARD